MKKFFLLIATVTVFTTVISAQDSTVNRTTNRPLRQRIHQQDHLVYQDGKMYRMQQGQQMEMKDKLTLQNGCIINPDGSYQLKDQKKLQLRNGECMDMNGNVYKSQRMINQGRMMNPSLMQRANNRGMNTNFRPGMGRRMGRS
jgi:hypothetical protein